MQTRGGASEEVPIKTLSSREVYRNRWMTVREDLLHREDGSEGLYGVVCKPDFCLVIPHEAGDFFLVEQYRHPIQARSLEFPQGSWETQAEVPPERVAAGELSEETGLVAGRMRYLGRVLTAPGYSTQGMHVFLAEQLTPGPQQLSPEERGLVCHRVGTARFQQLAREGGIQDASTLAAYALLHLHGLIPLPSLAP